MCTLIVLHRCAPDRPLVVAANRDEFFDRPAEGPALRSCATGPIVAPLDLEAGGTWAGLNARGVFAGLTNLRPADSGDRSAASEESEISEISENSEKSNSAILDRASKERAKAASSSFKLRSRGEVVMRALEAESATKAIRDLSKLEAGAYNPFQLLIADGREAWLLVYRGEARTIELEPGPHIVGNVVDERIEATLGVASKTTDEIIDSAPRARKLVRIRERVEKLMTESGRDLFEGLAGICREHVDSRPAAGNEGNEGHEREGRGRAGPFESTCVHVADRYGTRSSLLLEISLDPRASRLWTTDGPPCEWPYENRSSLLRELGVRLSARTETVMR